MSYIVTALILLPFFSFLLLIVLERQDRDSALYSIHGETDFSFNLYFSIFGGAVAVLFWPIALFLAALLVVTVGLKFSLSHIAKRAADKTNDWLDKKAAK